ncbi:hypothetical protein [Sinanaerobacter sp. ZZT-01]|uniref:hypothetical protein n=1 Tax=Sinanaerobacter sp. ZZT-01 TaxID=3111540 RepID=UPI002D772BB6|nr:hypothetical protein [Sinanaerobacter sp. ZZT-01]WRR92618.1 hypothetical protein U5921_11265 [Sinanaerobacter sp. ZZT-01]
MLKSKLSLLKSLAIGLVFVFSMSTVAFGMTTDISASVQDYSQYTRVVKGTAPNPNDTPADVGGTVVEITDESSIPIDKSEIKRIKIQQNDSLNISPLSYVFISDRQSKVSWSGQWLYVNYSFSSNPYKLSNVYWDMNVRKPSGSKIANTVTLDITPETPDVAINKTFAIYTGNNNDVNVHNWDHNFYFQSYNGNYGFNGDYVLSFSR